MVSRRIASLGLVLFVVGGAVTGLALTVMPWFRAGDGPYADGPSTLSFQDLRANFRNVHSGLAGHIFYGWLAWLLFIGIVIVGLLAFWRRMPPMGLVAGCLVVIALMSLPSTFVDLDNSRFLQHAGYGTWAWMAGQVLAVAGATLAHFGPQSFRGRGDDPSTRTSVNELIPT